MSRQTIAWSSIVTLVVLGTFWIKRQRSSGTYEPLKRTSLRETLARIDSDESTDVLVTKESEYPPNWWTSNELLDLERRAIFAKVRPFSIVTRTPCLSHCRCQ